MAFASSTEPSWCRLELRGSCLERHQGDIRADPNSGLYSIRDFLEPFPLVTEAAELACAL